MSTKRRGDLGVRQREPLRAILGIAEQQHVDVDRPRAVAHAAGVAAQVALDRLARIEQLLGPELGPIRTQALKNSGWSRTSPTGSVSYADDEDSTSTPWSGSRRPRPRGCARSPTFEPRPR